MIQSVRHLIAADIGNSRMKFARFELRSSPNDLNGQLPDPLDVLSLTPNSLGGMAAWMKDPVWRNAEIAIGSVQRTRTADAIALLRQCDFAGDIRLLTASDLPLEIDLPFPDRVGIDRLLAAVASNQLRESHVPAAIVDLGTAITVDLVSAQGVYLGGAIAPGVGLAAGALHQATDLLPEFDLAALDETIDPIGRDTVSAMKSGLFLGAVGTIRELVARQLESQTVSDVRGSGDAAARIFVCGGFGERVAHLLSPQAAYIPHLIPQGIAVAMRGLAQ
ncbi:MAG: type III pantothenate kinase [Pirellulales bacterium]|nr:type III pantothenate kinase [Pirellulales bacterium]